LEVKKWSALKNNKLRTITNITISNKKIILTTTKYTKRYLSTIERLIEELYGGDWKLDRAYRKGGKIITRFKPK